MMKLIRYIETFSNNGDFKRLFNTNAIVDNIIKILGIERGSYIGDPTVGSSLYKYIYNISDEETYNSILDDIKESLNNEGILIDDINIQVKDKKSIIINLIISLENFKKINVTIITNNEYIYLLEFKEVS